MKWVAPQASAPIAARVSVPGSKSASNRALILAALATGESELHGVLRARDTELMIAALRGLGVTITAVDGVLTVVPPTRWLVPSAPLDCGLAGTVLRFLPPVAALNHGTTSFVGDKRATQRPIAPLLDALTQLGAPSSAPQLPFTLSSPVELGGPDVTLDASSSSQFISALLLAAPRYPQGLDIRHVGATLPSQPHIDMTVAMLRTRGVSVTTPSPDRWVVAPGTIAPVNEHIEPDLTNAATFLIAGVLTKGWVEVDGWPAHSLQPGALLPEILTAFGARTKWHNGVLRASSDQPLRGTTIDLSAASELTCTVAALAGCATGTTTISGIGHIRGHETDRMAAISRELTRIGIPVTELDDALLISGCGGAVEHLHGTVFRTYGDHRMAHLGALLGLRIAGIELDDVNVTTKTMPDFPQRWAAMLGLESR